MSNAESIGFEPMDQFPDHGLANRSFNHSGNSPYGVGMGGLEPPTSNVSD